MLTDFKMANVSLIVSSPEISLAIEVIGLGEIYGRTVVTSPPLFPQQTSMLPPSHIRLQETSSPAHSDGMNTLSTYQIKSWLHIN